MSNATLTKKFLTFSSFEEFKEPAGQSHAVAQFTIELPDEIGFKVDEETSSATAILDVVSTLTAHIAEDTQDKVFEIIQKHRFIINITDFFLSESDENFAEIASSMLKVNFISNFINISCRDSVKQVINSTRFSSVEIPYNVEWTT